jgi:hypothetical protein
MAKTKGSEATKVNGITVMSNVQLIEVDKIYEYASNPRDHPQEQIDRLVAGYKEFGFFGQLVVNKDGQLIIGHGRLRAAKQAGMEKVPCVYAEHLTDKQVKALRIFDNRVSELGKTNKDFLSLELMDLKDLGYEMDLTGYKEGELELGEGMILGDGADFEPKILTGNKEPLRNMTFTVSDEQYDTIARAIKEARKGTLSDPSEVNENQNGNALYLFAKRFVDYIDSQPQVNSDVNVDLNVEDLP